jgi:hypothetical protein
MKTTLVGRRVKSIQTGETGTITKVINRCLWVHMDAGHNMSGAQRYWEVLPKSSQESK